MIEENNLTPLEYKDIALSVGWNIPPFNSLSKGLNNSFTVKYIINNETIGMGRFFSDKGFMYLISDLAVKKEYQNEGIGRIILNHLVTSIYKEIKEGDSVMVEAFVDNGKTGFYQKNGFFINTGVESSVFRWLIK